MPRRAAQGYRRINQDPRNRRPMAREIGRTGRSEGFEAAAAPTAPTAQAERFYAESLRELSTAQIPFLVAGTYAVSAYTGISRPTKDLDLFCRPGDYPRILGHFQQLGHQVRIEDERWIDRQSTRLNSSHIP